MPPGKLMVLRDTSLDRLTEGRLAGPSDTSHLFCFPRWGKENLKSPEWPCMLTSTGTHCKAFSSPDGEQFLYLVI